MRLFFVCVQLVIIYTARHLAFIPQHNEQERSRRIERTRQKERTLLVSVFSIVILFFNSFLSLLTNLLLLPAQPNTRPFTAQYIRLAPFCHPDLPRASTLPPNMLPSASGCRLSRFPHVAQPFFCIFGFRAFSYARLFQSHSRHDTLLPLSALQTTTLLNPFRHPTVPLSLSSLSMIGVRASSGLDTQPPANALPTGLFRKRK